MGREKCGNADALETQSTNCGNNITYLLELLEREKIPCRSIILCQDATMQRRMEMGLRKYRPQGMEIINYAAYQAEVVAQGSQLTYREAIPGMWTVDRYVNLLMGEIPRLTDNDAGCAPTAKIILRMMTSHRRYRRHLNGCKRFMAPRPARPTRCMPANSH